MADLRGAWTETGEKLAELGRKLKVHYDEQHGADGQRSRQELTDAAHKVRGAIQDAFEALGAAARDSSVQADVRQVGQSLVEALGATLGQASDEVRRAFSERKGPSGAAAPEAVAAPEAAAPEVAAPEATAPVEGTGAPDGVPNGAGDDARDGEGAAPPGEGAGKVEPWGTP